MDVFKNSLKETNGENAEGSKNFILPKWAEVSTAKDVKSFDDANKPITSKSGDIAFGSSAKEDYTKQAEYYQKEAKNAEEWAESYAKDGNYSKSASYLSSAKEKAEKAESYANAAKWADDKK